MKTKSILFLSLLLLLVCACSQEDEYSVNTTTVSVNPNDSVALSVTPANAGWVFTSANQNIAAVSAKGIIKGMHVGATTITVSDTISGFNAQVQVTVTAKNTLFREPCPTFFVDHNAVRAYETRELMSSGDLGTGISYLLYKPDNLFCEGVVYLFSDSLNYFESEVIVLHWYENKLNAHLNDRFVLNSTNTDYTVFQSPDSSTVVYKMYVDERYINVYTSPDYTGRIYFLTWSSLF